MAFHTLRVDIFEGIVKRLLHGRDYVTLTQLRYAFKHRVFWQKDLPYINELSTKNAQKDENCRAGILKNKSEKSDINYND